MHANVSSATGQKHSLQNHAVQKVNSLYHSQHDLQIYDFESVQFCGLHPASHLTHVSHPPRPSTETCRPEFPSRLYCIPVFLGSAHAMMNDAVEYV